MVLSKNAFVDVEINAPQPMLGKPIQGVPRYRGLRDFCHKSHTFLVPTRLEDRRVRGREKMMMQIGRYILKIPILPKRLKMPQMVYPV